MFLFGLLFFCWNLEGVRYAGPSKSHHSSTSSNLLILGRLHVLGSNCSKNIGKLSHQAAPKVLNRRFRVDSRLQLVRSRLGFTMSENHYYVGPGQPSYWMNLETPWWLSFLHGRFRKLLTPLESSLPDSCLKKKTKTYVTFQQILWTICRQGVQEVLIELHLENFEAAFQQRDIRSLQDLTKKSSFMRSEEGFVSEKNVL